MKKQTFHFKQFSLAQDKTAMKVGTDGVLLGAITKCPEQGRVLDVGTGTGLIAIMLAQRFPGIQVDAIDTEMAAVEQASENFAASPWTERLRAFHARIPGFSEGKYDVMVSNPPFYRHALGAVGASRKQSRQSEAMPFETLAAYANDHLGKNGKLWIIYPAEERDYLIETAAAVGLHPEFQAFVKPTILKAAHRVVMAFGRNKRIPETQVMSIEVLQRHDYSWQYKEMCKGFYLKF